MLMFQTQEKFKGPLFFPKIFELKVSLFEDHPTKVVELLNDIIVNRRLEVTSLC